MGTVYPFLMNRTTEVSPLERVTFAISILFAFTYFGQFISPLIMKSLTYWFHLKSIREMFLFTAVMLSVFLLLYLIYSILGTMKRRKKALVLM